MFNFSVIADCDDLFPIYCAMTITPQHRHMCNHPLAYQKCGKTCDKCHLTRHLTKRCEDLNTACADMQKRCDEGWVREVCPKTCDQCADGDSNWENTVYLNIKMEQCRNWDWTDGLKRTLAHDKVSWLFPCKDVSRVHAVARSCYAWSARCIWVQSCHSVA